METKKRHSVLATVRSRLDLLRSFPSKCWDIWQAFTQHLIRELSAGTTSFYSTRDPTVECLALWQDS